YGDRLVRAPGHRIGDRAHRHDRRWSHCGHGPSVGPRHWPDQPEAVKCHKFIHLLGNNPLMDAAFETPVAAWPRSLPMLRAFSARSLRSSARPPRTPFPKLESKAPTEIMTNTIIRSIMLPKRPLRHGGQRPGQVDSWPGVTPRHPSPRRAGGTPDA